MYVVFFYIIISPDHLPFLPIPDNVVVFLSLSLQLTKFLLLQDITPELKKKCFPVIHSLRSGEKRQPEMRLRSQAKSSRVGIFSHQTSNFWKR